MRPKPSAYNQTSIIRIWSSLLSSFRRQIYPYARLENSVLRLRDLLSELPYVSVQALPKSDLGSVGCLQEEEEQQQQHQKKDLLVQILSRENGSSQVVANTAKQLALSQGKCHRLGFFGGMWRPK